MKYIWEEKDIRGNLKFNHQGDIGVVGRLMGPVNYEKPFALIHDGYLVTVPFSAAEVAAALNEAGCTPISG